MVPTALGVAGTAVVAAGWLGLAGGNGGTAVTDEAFAGGAVGNAQAVVHAAAPAAAPARVSVADGATGVLPDSPLTVTAPPGEQVGAVELTYRTEAVQGTFSADRRTWTSIGPLRAGVSYALSAVTLDAAGGTGIQHSTFATSRPDSPLKIDLIAPGDAETVGVGQPVVLAFTGPVKAENRAAIEQALTVTSDPPQTGHWSWLSDNRVDYRPQNFWQVGTKVSVQMALNGLSDGNGHYATADHSVNFTVGRDQESTIDLRAHQLTVRQSGHVVRSFPITGGMPGLDTWGGTYAVIDKSPDVHMNSETAGLGNAYDIPDVKWDVHLTYTGTYVHSAPWSTGAQGVVNVSHGCVGASPMNAQWFFNSTLPGDVVRVVNSPHQANPGNGFADWQESWSQWLSGSALN
ncbi:MAG: Ig-like domain-containing protein [Actinocrinis sp.]